jgi:hypothetical protein
MDYGTWKICFRTVAFYGDTISTNKGFQCGQVQGGEFSGGRMI